MPVPVVVVPPGVSVNVHVPEAGKPFNITLPVDTTHVGWVIIPITGVDGGVGAELITTFSDDPDVHPDIVTVNEYVPAESPDMVVLDPVPVVVPPGVLLNVQVPDDGRSFNTTLPVESEQVGWVIVPIVGRVRSSYCCTNNNRI